MGLGSFMKFLEESQSDDVRGRGCEALGESLSNMALMSDYITRHPQNRASVQPHFSFEDFVDYLYSPANAIVHPRPDSEGEAMATQNMDRPLSHYFINSSHNTYLTGNQLTSESSVQAYERVLLQGARCIELDCWDGGDGPIITHGHTICTKIRLLDIVKCIRDNAFVASPFPLILSIEDHCSLAQQSTIAQIFREYLGDLLLVEPVATDYCTTDSKGTRLLPSPNQLRNKIIIKHKAPNEPAQQETRSNSLPLSASSPVDEDSLEEDDNLSKFSHDVKFQSRCHFKMGGSASEGEWQEALCVFEKGKMELHLKKCRLEITQDLGAKATDVIRLTIKNEAKISRQITHCKGFRPHTAFVNGSEAASHYFVLTIPASETSPVIYLTAPTEAEVNDLASKLELRGAKMPEEAGTSRHSATDDQVPCMEPHKVAPEVVELMVYCKAVSFGRDALKSTIRFVDFGNCEVEMNSFNEIRAKELMVEGHRPAFQWRHRKYLSRVYPKARRTDSSNFNPVPFWLSGVQMVALNFQTRDKELQINRGWFRQNGGCGYVLKPDIMTDGCFDPNTKVVREDSVELTISVLSGRHLHRNVRSSAASNVFVKLEVIGCPVDCSYGITETANGNALNPSWDETFEFGVIHTPSLAVLRISVYNQTQSQKEMLGQSCVPAAAVRKGYRSVTLYNGFGEHIDHGLSALLVFIEMKPAFKDDIRLKKLLEDFSRKQVVRRDSGRKTDEVPDFALEALTELMGQKTISRDESSNATPTGPPPPKGGQQQQQRSQPRKVSSLPFCGLAGRCSKKRTK